MISAAEGDVGKCTENDSATGVLSRWRFCGKPLGYCLNPGDLTLEGAFLSVGDKQAETCYLGGVHRGNRRKLDAVMSRGKICKGQGDLLPDVFFCGEGGLVADAVEKVICTQTELVAFAIAAQTEIEAGVSRQIILLCV